MFGHFKCPLNVTPLIRATRWSMLIGGVAYGVFRHNVLQKYEGTYREHRLQMQIERDEAILKLKVCVAEDSSAAQNEDQKTATDNPNASRKTYPYNDA